MRLRFDPPQTRRQLRRQMIVAFLFVAMLTSVSWGMLTRFVDGDHDLARVALSSIGLALPSAIIASVMSYRSGLRRLSGPPVAAGAHRARGVRLGFKGLDTRERMLLSLGVTISALLFALSVYAGASGGALAVLLASSLVLLSVSNRVGSR